MLKHLAGGVILIKLKRSEDVPWTSSSIRLKATYVDRAGKESGMYHRPILLFLVFFPFAELLFLVAYEQEVRVPHEVYEDQAYYSNTGIRKAILLTRYAALVKHWSIDTRLKCADISAATESTEKGSTRSLPYQLEFSDYLSFLIIYYT